MRVFSDGRGYVQIKNTAPGVVECKGENSHSYHCLHVTTKDVERSSIFNLPFDHMVQCTRQAGWQLFQGRKVIAGEYEKQDQWIILDVGGVEIVNSRDREVLNR